MAIFLIKNTIIINVRSDIANPLVLTYDTDWRYCFVWIQMEHPDSICNPLISIAYHLRTL